MKTSVTIGLKRRRTSNTLSRPHQAANISELAPWWCMVLGSLQLLTRLSFYTCKRQMQYQKEGTSPIGWESLEKVRSGSTWTQAIPKNVNNIQ